MVTVPFADLYDKILTDLATGTNSYDAVVFAPQWMGDFVPPGYLEDMTERVKADQALKWDDIAPFFRDFSASYKGDTYTIPLDGDFQMVYYRSDLLKRDGLKPPETWDDYLAIAERYNGKDLNGDGKADYGSCIAKKRDAQSYWFVVGRRLLPPGEGTSQGAFFDADTMKPLVNNEAFAHRPGHLQGDHPVRPKDELNLDVGDTRGLFTSRPLRPVGRLGRHRHPGHRPQDLDREGQGGRGHHARVEAGAGPGQRQAGRLRRHHLPARHRRRQPRAVRRLRRLVGGDQRRRRPEGQGRRLRVPVLHERSPSSPTST